jgi:hypothetical protein
VSSAAPASHGLFNARFAESQPSPLMNATPIQRRIQAALLHAPVISRLAAGEAALGPGRTERGFRIERCPRATETASLQFHAAADPDRYAIELKILQEDHGSRMRYVSRTSRTA